MCGVNHWLSVLRNLIFQADKVYRSDPNFIVPRGSDVHMWIGWLHIEAGLISLPCVDFHLLIIDVQKPCLSRLSSPSSRGGAICLATSLI